MAKPFRIEALTPVDKTTGDFDLFKAPYKFLPFSVPVVKTIVVNSSDEANLPSIAERELLDPELWWVLLMYNGIIDPISDVKVGSIIRIPDLKYLTNVLQLYSSTDVTKDVVI